MVHPVVPATFIHYLVLSSVLRNAYTVRVISLEKEDEAEEYPK